MSDDAAGDAAAHLSDFQDIIEDLLKELEEVVHFRDYFFENHPIELATQKTKLVEERRCALLKRFENIDVDTQVPASLRAQFSYLKGRCYNILPTYNPEAIAYLSKAIKLNPYLIEAWNELGECYWKNLNVKDAKSSFEGALKHVQNQVSLRCISIIMRQEVAGSSVQEASAAIIKSVEKAKEAVNLDAKDGLSWSILGNAYLCQYFMVSQDPEILRSCMTAYKQAYQDPVARGQPDLYYNRGIALKYEECYKQAVDSFETACRLDPPWKPPQAELQRLRKYLHGVNELIKTKGKIKLRKINQMVKSLDSRMLGPYVPLSIHKFGTRENVTLTLIPLAELKEGSNEGTVVLAKVLGSIYSDNAVPFSFAISDASGACCSVTVYNWADGRGAIIGDSIAIPEPVLTTHIQEGENEYNFKSIRVNNPLMLALNGKLIGRNQFARTKVTSSEPVSISDEAFSDGTSPTKRCPLDLKF